MPGYKVGELVLSSKPYAYALNNQKRGEYCDACFTRNRDLKRCSGCSFLYFCDRKCQLNAWSDHKLECKYIKLAGEKKPTATLRLISLIIFKIKKYGKEEPFEEVGGRKISFSTLMSHVEDFKQDLMQCQLMMALMITVKEFIGANNMPSHEEFIEIYGKMCINSHSICNGEIISIGTGLYLGGSMFNHNCDPDAVIVFEGTTLNVRTVKNLDHKDINKVCISYVGNLRPSKIRQKKLKKRYFFTCNCSFCTTEKYDDLMSELTNDSEEAKQLAASCEQEFKRLSSIDKYDNDPEMLKEGCERLFKIQEEIMADSHICKVRTQQIAFDACLQLNEWENALNVGLWLEKPFRLYKGKYHPLLATHLFALGKLLHLLDRFKEAIEKFEQAEVILKVTHGVHHPLLLELQSLIEQAKVESRVVARQPKSIDC